MDHPPLEKSYPLNVANVVLALFPGLINTSAIAILAPALARDLHVAPDQAGTLPLLNDAALAFGCLLAAELARRYPGRALFTVLMSLSLVTSLASALAPSFPVLLAAHIVHGLLGGMLFVVMLPPLLTTFGSAKIRSTATVLVPSLFGAATLGPVLGALVAAPQLWRAIFAGEVVMSAAALALGALTLALRAPPPTDDPPDIVALAFAAIGSACIFIGAGALAAHDWTYLPALLPLAGGVACFVALFVFEALTPRPLVPVRRLATSIAAVGAVASVIGSAVFAATQQCVVLALERIDGLGLTATGFAFWPGFLAALTAGAVFGAFVSTRWLIVMGTAGLAISALAALVARAVMPVSASSAPWIVTLAALGAGFAVTPGIFIVALSFERALVARAIALLNLLRLSGGFISSPGVEHTIGNRTATRLAASPGAAHAGRAAVRHFIVTGAHDGTMLPALQAALGGALGDALAITAALAVLGVVVNAAVLIAAHVPLRAPDLAAIDDGKPAIGTASAVAAVLVAMLVAAPARGASAEPSLVPRPAERVALACRAPLSLAHVLRVPRAIDAGGLELVRERWSALGILAPVVVGARTDVRVRRRAGIRESSTLTISDAGVALDAADGDGEFDALATLAQLPERDAQGRWTLPCERISDRPAMRWRIVSDDISRGPFPTMTYFRTRIRGLAQFKINGYSPYMENVFADPRYPFVASPERLSAGELRALAIYAQRFHVTLIPEQQTFAHMHETLKYEQLADLAELPHGYLLSPSDDGTYAYLGPLLRAEVAAVGAVPFFHIGADEPLDLGRGRTPRTPAAFAGHVARVAALLGPGPRPLIWDDSVQADRSLLALLPPATAIVAFHYGVEPSYTRYLTAIAGANRDVFASPGAANWNEIYPDLSTAYDNNARFIADAQRLANPHVLGTFETVWHDDGETLYDATWAPVAFAAATAWQSAPVDRRTWHRDFAAVFFGPDDAARDAADLDALQSIRDGLHVAPETDPPDYLFWSDPFDTRIQSRVAGLDLAAIRRRAEAVLTHLDTSPPARNAPAAAVMRLGAWRYDVLARRFQIGKEARDDYDDARAHAAAHDDGVVYRDLNIAKYLCWELRDEMTALAPMYAAAWNAESRPGGRDRVLVRYARAAQIAVGEADHLYAAAREDYLRGGTLPPFDDAIGGVR